MNYYHCNNLAKRAYDGTLTISQIHRAPKIHLKQDFFEGKTILGNWYHE
jgi:hypothetical protein